MSQVTEMVVIIRPSFMKFCQDGCRAAVFNHILYWIVKKAKDEPPEKAAQGEIYWYASNEELTSQMAGSWSHCKVQKETNALVAAGLVGVARNPKWGLDRTKHFYIGREQGKKLLELCEKHHIDLTRIGLSTEVLHYLNLVNGLPTSSQSITSIQAVDYLNLGDELPKSSGAIPKVSTKVTTKEGKKERSSKVIELVTTSPSLTLIPSSRTSTPLSALLTPEQHHWFEGIFCHGKWYVVPPKLTQTLAEHVKKLYPIIKTVDDLNSLYDFEKERLKDKPDPIVKPGNLASSDTLNAWMQTRIPVVAQASIRTESTGQYGPIDFGKDPRALAFFRERSAK